MALGMRFTNIVPVHYSFQLSWPHAKSWLLVLDKAHWNAFSMGYRRVVYAEGLVEHDRYRAVVLLK
jgi:hypothetical protein